MFVKACLKYFEGLNVEALEHVKSMLVFDAVVYNEDCHFGNFGVLRDNHRGEVIGRHLSSITDSRFLIMQ